MKTSTQSQTPRTLPAPGSWYASPNSGRFGSWDIYTKSGSYHIGDATAPHGAAGARDNCTLAAAAPDLLQASKCFVSVFELLTPEARADLPNSVCNVVVLFEEAIAKAEGRA